MPPLLHCSITTATTTATARLNIMANQDRLCDIKAWFDYVVPARQKSTLMKQLMRHLHSKKGQDRTLPASLWMR
ncbi:MAG TPA: hypothetical protein VIM43_02830 [Rugosibacter sp.]